MKARIISDPTHLIGKLFTEFFTCQFFSRHNNFDLTNDDDINKLVETTDQYDWTVIIPTAKPYGSTNLLSALQNHCHIYKTSHKVFNIGSYMSFVYVNTPTSTYDVNKVASKFMHRKIANEYLFHNGTLDSRLLNLNYIEQLSTHVETDYKHLKVLSLESISKNIKFMLDNPSIKELSLQSNQPGNHRVNEGIGNILPSMF